jgi:fatty acid desaturase
MNLELAAWWGLVFFAAWKLPVQVMIFLYWLPFVLGSIVTSMTSMIEHFEMEEGPDEYSSRTYGTKSYLLNFLWNNVTFHNEHHKYPGIPWYNLRSFHEAAYPYYDDRIKAKVFTNFLPVVWMLYKRIFQIDVAKIEAKYAHMDRAAEREKQMSRDGIAPEHAEGLASAEPANA